jgi:type IV secretion system protein VirD4
MSKKIRKHIIPNVPYLFALWFCLKLGTAYRLSEGMNFGQKLIGIFQTLGLALEDISPGLHAFDWLVGIVGAILLRTIIYFKVKNAKKYRRDVEYGSARWGTEKVYIPA